MEQANRTKYEKYIYEIIFLITLIFLSLIQDWLASNSFNYFFDPPLFFLILGIQAYAYRFIAMPYLSSGRHLQFVGISIIYVLTLVLIFFLFNRYWPNQDYVHGQRKSTKFVIYYVATCVFSSIMIIALSMVRRYYLEHEKRIKDQFLMSEMTIRALHAQLNPHFFFNMLNNLYGVSLTDPKRTPELILQLSKLMRYPLENGNKPLVILKQELEFVESYVNMEKERSGNQCRILTVFPTDQSSTSRLLIAPFILITLLENAFKHSAGSTNWFVNLQIELTSDTLKLKLINSLPNFDTKVESTGIGLSNVRKRLELLYPSQYTFENFRTADEFTTLLILKLTHI